MNRLSTERRGQVISLLCEGMSIRSIVRVTGVAKNTVVKLLVDLGHACLTDTPDLYNRTHVRVRPHWTKVPRLASGFVGMLIPVVSAHDVARELRYRLPSVGQKALHKLLYYCQGWYLEWTGQRLFPEELEAWEHGPVVADLWRSEARDDEPPTPALLDELALSVVGFVASRYGRLSGRELEELSHSESPWKNAWNVGRNTVIDDGLLLADFSSDPDELEMMKLLHELEKREEFKRVVDVASRPRSKPVEDETDKLRALLK